MSDSEGELSVTGQKEGKTTSWQLEHTARVGGQIRYSGASASFFSLPCLEAHGRMKSCSVNAASWFRSVKLSPVWAARSRRSSRHHRRGGASPASIK